MAGEIYSHLSISAEVMATLLPTGIMFYRRAGERLAELQGWLFLTVTLALVLLASGGFALVNLNAGVEARAERQTADTRLAERKLVTITVSRQAECAQRGPRCRTLEADEQTAMNDLILARSAVKAEADPQAAAPGITSTKLHLTQAAALVRLCLCAGLFISFGSGLLFPSRS